MHVWDASSRRIVLAPALTWVPGLYKIFDEILVNAADNKRRDARMNCLRVTVDAPAGRLSVWNNGEGGRQRLPHTHRGRAALPRRLAAPGAPHLAAAAAQARASPSSSTASTTCGSRSSSSATC